MRISSDTTVTETLDNNEFSKLFKIFNYSHRARYWLICSHWWWQQSFVLRRDVRRSKPFFGEQQALNQDENIISNEDELILLVKGYKLAIFLITFT